MSKLFGSDTGSKVFHTFTYEYFAIRSEPNFNAMDATTPKSTPASDWAHIIITSTFINCKVNTNATYLNMTYITPSDLSCVNDLVFLKRTTIGQKSIEH